MSTLDTPLQVQKIMAAVRGGETNADAGRERRRNYSRNRKTLG